MSISDRRKPAVAIAVLCIALLGAGRYSPPPDGAYGKRSLFGGLRMEYYGEGPAMNPGPGSTFSTQPYAGEWRGPGGLSPNRQEHYDKSYWYRLKKRRCCQLIRGESYYDPDPPYCHPTHGYHETLWRRFPSENLISGQPPVGYGMPMSEYESAMPESVLVPDSNSDVTHPTEITPPNENRTFDPGAPTPTPPSPMPPDGSALIPRQSPAVPRPTARISQMSATSVSSDSLRKMPVREKVAHPAVFELPQQTFSGQQGSFVPSRTTVAPVTPRGEKGWAPSAKIAPERETFAPTKQPIRRISQDSDNIIPPRSSAGWRPRRK